MTTNDRHDIDFDHHAAEFRTTTVPRGLAGLHEAGCPLGCPTEHGGFWAIYGYDAALRRGAGLPRLVQLRSTVRAGPEGRAARPATRGR